MAENPLDFLEDFPVGVCLLSREHTIKLWNRRLEVWTGYEASEVLGKDARVIFPKLCEPRYRNRIELLYQGGAPAIFSALLHKDIFTPRYGSEYRSVFNTTAMAKQSLCHPDEYDVLFVVEDVTAFHKRTEQLEAMNAQLESFVHAASHDLRAPLRRISGFAQVLQEELGGTVSEEIEKYLAFMVKQSQQLDKLLIALLDYARAVSGEMQIVQCSMDEALDRALGALQPYLDERQATIIREPLPKVYCDGYLMSLVLQNLVGNAVKYNQDPTPTVSITFMQHERSDVYPIFMVKDNGIGIEAAYLEDIFSPFKRLHAQQEYNGSGIGLSTCRNIIRRHSGIIWAENNDEGGASFYFAFANEEPVQKGKL